MLDWYRTCSQRGVVPGSRDGGKCEEEDADAPYLYLPFRGLAPQTQGHAAQTSVRNTDSFRLTRPAMMLDQSATGLAMLQLFCQGFWKTARESENSSIAQVRSSSPIQRLIMAMPRVCRRRKSAWALPTGCVDVAPPALQQSAHLLAGMRRCGAGVLRRLQFYDATTAGPMPMRDGFV